MTTDDLRDRLAELVYGPGLFRTDPETGRKFWKPNIMADWIYFHGPLGRHPFPPNDYNALIAVWPDAIDLTIKKCHQECGGFVWYAKVHGQRLEGVMAPTEYEARLRLTVAALEANRP